MSLFKDLIAFKSCWQKRSGIYCVKQLPIHYRCDCLREDIFNEMLAWICFMISLLNEITRGHSPLTALNQHMCFHCAVIVTHSGTEVGTNCRRLANPLALMTEGVDRSAAHHFHCTRIVVLYILIPPSISNCRTLVDPFSILARQVKLIAVEIITHLGTADGKGAGAAHFRRRSTD